MEPEITQDDIANLVFNGIDGATGDYLTPAMKPRQLVKIAAGESLDPKELDELKRKRSQIKEMTYWAGENVDEGNLEQAGWGVIFAPDITEGIKQALSPLLELREAQAKGRYTEFPGARGYHIGDDKNKFLSRSGMGPGTPNTKRVPYHLLIVGSPESIPYRFQYQMDLQYAVGRIHFDTPEEYASYARSVVRADQGTISRPREATFFGARNRADRATQLSADHLVKPLRDAMAEAEPSWKWPCLLGGDQATKQNLLSLLGGERTPALLFTATHGMSFGNGDPRQATDQGALLCQEWPGPLRHTGPIPDAFYVAGRHLLDSASVEGLILFSFACFGAGTPKFDDFAHLVDGPQATVAPEAFLGALPKRLLSHPGGAALAIIGHVDRAWSYSFVWDRSGEQLQTFENVLTALVNGKRIGVAMEYLNSRYAELSADLDGVLEDRKNYRPDLTESETKNEDETTAGMWTAKNDARSYVLLGDPAVRLAVAVSPLSTVE
jgi:hypothetical protein